MMLQEKYLEILEELDWSICGYTDDGRVEVEKYSPAGEDFIMCVEVENFPKAVAEYYQDFDVDEHIEMWIEAKNNGVSRVPSVRMLVKDAEEIEKMLEELADALNCEKKAATGTEDEFLKVDIKERLISIYKNVVDLLKDAPEESECTEEENEIFSELQNFRESMEHFDF